MNIGLLPAMISVYIVPKIGLQIATQMMLSGKRYSASGLKREKTFEFFLIFFFNFQN